MQEVTLSGNLGKDAELKRTQSGKDVCSFNVGVKNGLGRDAGTVWYRCSLWGNAATAFAPSLLKGTKVFITGDLVIGEYQDKPQYDVSVRSIDTAARAGGEQRGGGDGYTPPKREPLPFDDDDLNDSVPFASCDPSWERRVS